MIEMSPPPISGETPPPARELKAEKEAKPPKPVKLRNNPKIKLIKNKLKSKNFLLFIILLVVFFLGGIVLGLYLKRKNGKQALPSPSPSPTIEPSPSPSPSPLSEGLEGKLMQFEEHLEEVDLKEEELTPPALDFDIRFKVK